MKRASHVFRFIAISTLACYCNGAKAQTWAKEPDAFMGIKFGQSLTAQVKRCRNGFHPRYDETNKNQTCIESLTKDKTRFASAALVEAPYLGISGMSTLMAELVDGNVEGMHFNYNRIFRDKVSDLLLARYGKPTRSESVSYQTAGGGVFRGTNYVWEGKNVTITWYEYFTQVDTDAVYVKTKKLVETEAAEERKKAVGAKDRL